MALRGSPYWRRPLIPPHRTTRAARESHAQLCWCEARTLINSVRAARNLSRPVALVIRPVAPPEHHSSVIESASDDSTANAQALQLCHENRSLRRFIITGCGPRSKNVRMSKRLATTFLEQPLDEVGVECAAAHRLSASRTVEDRAPLIRTTAHVDVALVAARDPRQELARRLAFAALPGLRAGARIEHVLKCSKLLG